MLSRLIAKKIPVIYSRPSARMSTEACERKLDNLQVQGWFTFLVCSGIGLFTMNKVNKNHQFWIEVVQEVSAEVEEFGKKLQAEEEEKKNNKKNE
jgi:hypothetical protein